MTTLALKVGRGDRGAADQFVRLSTPDVWRLCARLGSKQDADDLTQETYVRAFRSVTAFRGESSARTWLLVIARRVCADHVRKQTRIRALSSRLAELREPVATQMDTSMEFSDLVKAVEVERREAYVLTQELGLSYSEAAEVCDCAVGTIRSRVFRARSDMIGMLKAQPQRSGLETRRIG